ncbi:MAG: BON domain-containing protein [Desulfitobacteriaceae bacterium]|nr:BON domain-containing protein [Desulfitobacteriaceae bacterium]MDD4752202.1 BON domain-containing protein [Desulfitobacteriaceae bacterium]
MHNQYDEFTLKEKIEKELPSALEIDVEIDEGNAVLTGVVDSLAEKEQVDEIVKRFPDVNSIQNFLIIAIDKNINDKELKEKIEEELLAFGANLLHLSVNVDSGTVFLGGVVREAKIKENALDLIARIPGVAGVYNHLRVMH